mmetsp:Transcript_32757/g.59328  ORF Transcript_32757/g.59328 Transcript_32757/m.59328 type:complete len:275 (+) Transcript_32757:273-1097(+)
MLDSALMLWISRRRPCGRWVSLDREALKSLSNLTLNTMILSLLHPPVTMETSPPTTVMAVTSPTKKSKLFRSRNAIRSTHALMERTMFGPKTLSLIVFTLVSRARWKTDLTPLRMTFWLAMAFVMVRHIHLLLTCLRTVLPRECGVMNSTGTQKWRTTGPKLTESLLPTNGNGMAKSRTLPMTSHGISKTAYLAWTITLNTGRVWDRMNPVASANTIHRTHPLVRLLLSGDVLADTLASTTFMESRMRLRRPQRAESFLNSWTVHTMSSKETLM